MMTSPVGRRSKRALGLLRVILAIGLLVLLTAFVVPSIGDRRPREAGLASGGLVNGPIGSALQRYRWDMGTYPTTNEGLRALFLPPAGMEGRAKWKGPYLRGSPDAARDPWGNPYQYRFPGRVSETEFEVWSAGPDGKDETDDDITSWKKQ